ncbi:hypothetical protein AAS23_gp60 [Pantoea phage vB_PagS_AAS23]|uniref:Uncharacterized protein n=1 Tax=Pantoea phage vB_PagS_AAS23 TaxID=2499073 RepID=A0A3S9U7Z8_9CAUD|nr:hypothetical protein HOU93_gp60 [Pantoea phage vB_PagS_AAS23]AZS06373.1 hypothetical protein AAS23_gp60 [Pantoea phage vB_PagS_AAS23]
MLVPRDAHRHIGDGAKSTAKIIQYILALRDDCATRAGRLSCFDLLYYIKCVAMNVILI